MTSEGGWRAPLFKETRQDEFSEFFIYVIRGTVWPRPRSSLERMAQSPALWMEQTQMPVVIRWMANIIFGGGLRPGRLADHCGVGQSGLVAYGLADLRYVACAQNGHIGRRRAADWGAGPLRAFAGHHRRIRP